MPARTGLARSLRIAAIVGACPILGACGGRNLTPSDESLADLYAVTDVDQRVAPLELMSGSWRSLDKEGLSEEIWSMPHGSSMVGVFRMAKPDGSLAMEEILAVTAEGEGVFLRLRHFDAKLTAREDKDSPIVLQLEKAADNLAVFRKVSGSATLDTITYRRVDQTLQSEVAFTPESKRQTLKFEMRRIAVQAW